MSLGYVFFVLNVAFATSLEVTPVEKVISLLENLKTEIETEGKEEAATYEKFACFCKDTTSTKVTSITDGQDTIDKLSASIAENTALKATDETKLGELKTEKESLSNELEETTSRCSKEKAEYEANAADLNKAISSLKAAIKAMSDKRKALEAVSAASLLDISSSIRETLNLAEAMGFVPTPKQKTISGFLQQTTAVDPSDPEYKYHSQDIVDLLESLEKDFTEEKTTVDIEWGKTDKACSDLKTSLGEKLETNKDASSTTEGNINKLGTEIADDRGKLVEAQDLMKDDEEYMKDLTSRCETRAGEWDQRSQMRADEITAISTALKILGDKVQPADTEVNKRVLLQGVPEPKVAIVNKTSASHEHSEPATKVKAVTSFLQRASVQLHEHDLNSQEQMRDRVVVTIRDAGIRLGSPVLTALAMQVAADPFKKVKQLIQGLLERLIKEAASEATKKGWCDTELGKAKKDREFRWTEVNKLEASIAILDAKEETLTEEVASLSTSIESLQEALKMGAEERQREKKENAETIATAQEGLTAVQEALKVLRAFYKSAAKAEVLLQASPVDEDLSKESAGAGFSGAYQGRQEGSHAVLDLLETIASDFQRTIVATEKSEKQSAEHYTRFVQVSKVDIGGKTTKKELNEQDLVTTKNTLEKQRADIKTNMDLVDDAVKTIMELKPACIDTGMSYSDRVAKREEEVDALKKALCILDPNKVEPECA
jgi:septal ring factor EnvC (AmiA/AmiB activator)|eukprot:CAMPEP_0169099984 /NCGR_PEP_ID=MMETSP1015-20121227/20843_1 /TAXON_ID=342587 /ORGANISM="Karlodinium micrum, Strain CCMP2283" /LENGTH=717 /DNA_ID=CAMNT_0009160891 /DNA_START=62 /DNA_END=2215 /DNA_ORIENTATION=-